MFCVWRDEIFGISIVECMVKFRLQKLCCRKCRLPVVDDFVAGEN